MKWFNTSHKDDPVVPIDEKNLLKVLNGEPFKTYVQPVSRFNFRF